MGLFLRELLRHLRGPVIVLLDNSSTHHGEALAKLLDRHPRLHLEYFPSYAPELNPDEGVWSLAKRDLANGGPLDAAELMDDVFASTAGCTLLLITHRSEGLDMVDRVVRL